MMFLFIISPQVWRLPVVVGWLSVACGRECTEVIWDDAWAVRNGALRSLSALMPILLQKWFQYPVWSWQVFHAVSYDKCWGSCPVGHSAFDYEGGKSNVWVCVGTSVLLLLYWFRFYSIDCGEEYEDPLWNVLLALCPTSIWEFWQHCPYWCSYRCAKSTWKGGYSFEQIVEARRRGGLSINRLARGW